MDEGLQEPFNPLKSSLFSYSTGHWNVETWNPAKFDLGHWVNAVIAEINENREEFKRSKENLDSQIKKL
jgi:hypothetical protein